MTVINRIIVETVDLVARQVQNANNNGTTLLGSDAASLTSTPLASSTGSSTAASSSPAQPQQNGGGQSPLLFFVALGFGVVFTNLWIIVGVKYCFRYNARQRALARGENPDEVALDAMPAGRPHRRRREKKLMTMDEVNERFPLIKYKNWMATRASQGLSTSGGVDATPSRAASIRNADGDMPRSPISMDRPDTAMSKERKSIDATPSTQAGDVRASMDSDKRPRTADVELKSALSVLTEVQTTGTLDEAYAKDAMMASHAVDESDEEDEHIPNAIAADIVDQPGDSCAICIDTLEADDEVRGLTCGHAFHAGCLDPWLTSRRACCPLCKADYFVPKPKPEGAAEVATDEAAAERRRRRAQRNGPQPPPEAHTGILGRGPRFLPRSLRSPWLPTDNSQAREAPRTERSRRVAEARANAVADARANPEPAPQSRPGLYSRLTSGFASSIPLLGRRHTNSDPTPAQMEAGSPVVR